MTGEGQRQIVGVDAAAVIDDANQFGAALLDLDIDAPAAGIDGVFEQFLDDAGGSFDDLAGGDLADDERRQLLDTRHLCSLESTMTEVYLPQPPRRLSRGTWSFGVVPRASGLRISGRILQETCSFHRDNACPPRSASGTSGPDVTAEATDNTAVAESARIQARACTEPASHVLATAPSGTSRTPVDSGNKFDREIAHFRERVLPRGGSPLPLSAPTPWSVFHTGPFPATRSRAGNSRLPPSASAYSPASAQ